MARAIRPELSLRDTAILRDLDRVRLLTGRHLERLHFADLATVNARGSARRRSMARLQAQGLVTTLARRVGGVRAGSAGLVYVLDAAAHRQRELWDTAALSSRRIRRPWAIGWPFVSHTLGVAELYVRLRERERERHLRLVSFVAEPGSWYEPGDGVVKPDAFAVYDFGGWQRHRWFEVDRATESLSVVRRKLVRYAELVAAGDAGPDGVLPGVVFVVPDCHRQQQLDQLASATAGLPDGYVVVTLADQALQASRPPP